MITIILKPAGSTDEQTMANMLSQAGQIVANGLASGALVAGEVTTVDWQELAQRAEAKLMDPNDTPADLAVVTEIRDAQIRAVRQARQIAAELGVREPVLNELDRLVSAIRDGLQP